MQNIKIFPLVQAAYFFLTAVWPFVDITSFLEVTGDKKEIWLIRIVSVLLLPYCFILLHLSFSDKKNFMMAIVIFLCNLGLAVTEMYYFFNGTIKWVYFVDGALQLLFMGYWIWYIILTELSYSSSK
jgi:hypothetical protein